MPNVAQLSRLGRPLFNTGLPRPPVFVNQLELVLPSGPVLIMPPRRKIQCLGAGNKSSRHCCDCMLRQVFVTANRTSDRQLNCGVAIQACYSLWRFVGCPSGRLEAM